MKLHDEIDRLSCSRSHLGTDNARRQHEVLFCPFTTASLRTPGGWLLEVIAVVAIVAMSVAASEALAGTPTIRSVVVFNTVCAQCHEMECSRRLAFSSESAAERARGHIENYAGPLPPAQVEELFGLIDYTKRHCDYLAPDVAIPANGVWSAAALAPLATPAHTGWFVPLGALSARTWLLELRVAGNQAIDIEIVTRLGAVVQQQISAGAGEARVVFK